MRYPPQEIPRKILRHLKTPPLTQSPKRGTLHAQITPQKLVDQTGTSQKIITKKKTLQKKMKISILNTLKRKKTKSKKVFHSHPELYNN
jgi:hypothetical protein